MRPIFGRPSYGLHLVELEPGQAIERDGYQVIPTRSAPAARRSATRSSSRRARGASTSRWRGAWA